jgi:hypothetical protein
MELVVSKNCPSILVGELCSGDDRHQGALLWMDVRVAVG